ncbi:MAG: PAS domain-containing protein, partial [Burkholderiaceae bacterium]|nr:PAS domain-containing protein [Burkholderiaceae bacterium]
MLLELAKGVALLLALSQLYSYSVRALRLHPWLSQGVGGLLFGGICVVGMLMPLQIAPGVIFDARSVVLSMASLFGGPWVGSLAAGIAATYRWHLGGAGAPVGVAVALACYGLGLAYYWLHRGAWVGLGWWQLLLFGVFVHVVEIYLFTWLPGELGATVLQTIALPILLVFSPATLLMGVILKDVQARMATEDALGSQEERLRATIGAIPDLLYVLDAHGTFVEVLSDAALLRGGRGQNLLGKRLHDVLPPEDAEPLLAHLQRTLALQTTQTFEFNLQSKHGVRRFEGRAHALKAVPGQSRCLVLLARDVTERSEAEAALQASEQRFRSLLQNVGAVSVQGYTPDGT